MKFKLSLIQQNEDIINQEMTTLTNGRQLDSQYNHLANFYFSNLESEYLPCSIEKQITKNNL